MKPTAYVLFSNGLDSRLALKIMQEQAKSRFKIIALYFKFPFLKDSEKEIKKFFKKTKIIDCTKGKLFQEYLKIIKKPKYGYGTAINPCIDCRIFILKYVRKLLKKNDFIVTGEVLGERPMSQHKRAMLLIEKTSELKGKILRPLSARLLEETDVEKKEIIDRKKLFSIQGRGRKKQIELAKKYKIKYPSPAGGCLLCEYVFSKRLKDLFKRKKKIEPRDIELLKIGRHFLFKEYRIIVGRNHSENLIIQKLKEKKEKIFEFKNKPGPSVLLQGKNGEKKAKELLLKYSKNKDKIIQK